MNDIFKKALEELNDEDLLVGTRITKKGKAELDKMLKSGTKIRKIVLKVLWKKLENDFYELEPRDFALKVLALEIMLKNSGVSLAEELEKV